MNRGTILVTGGAGFIGSNFVRYILSQDNQLKIVNFDKLTYAGNLLNLVEFEQCNRYKFFKGDITIDRDLNDVFTENKIDFVINFAAESHVDRSILNPHIFIETNIVGTQKLIHKSLDFGVKKFIQISTDEVYGDLNDTNPKFTEESTITPSSPYSSSKASADLISLAAYRTYDLPVIITRCSNNYGPYQFPEKLIPLTIDCFMNNRKVPIYGKGNNIRDWIYVTDHCSGIYSALQKGKFGEVYNFGGDCEIRNIDIVSKISELMGIKEDLIDFVQDRKGHDYRYAVNIEKSRNDLGWEPLIKFEEGIYKTISWYQKNVSWLEKIKSGEYKKSN